MTAAYACTSKATSCFDSATADGDIRACCIIAAAYSRGTSAACCGKLACAVCNYKLIVSTVALLQARAERTALKCVFIAVLKFYNHHAYNAVADIERTSTACSRNININAVKRNICAACACNHDFVGGCRAWVSVCDCKRGIRTYRKNIIRIRIIRVLRAARYRKRADNRSAISRRDNRKQHEHCRQHNRQRRYPYD